MAFIVFALIFGFAIYAAIVDREFATVIIGLSIAIFGGLVGAVFVDMPGLYLTSDKVERSRPLVAITDNNGPGGNFFLGSGVIDNQASFSYYVKNGESFRLETVSSFNADIVEIDDGTPRIARSCHDMRTGLPPFSWTSSFMFDRFDCDNDATFYVPKGSIKQQFILDTE